MSFQSSTFTAQAQTKKQVTVIGNVVDLVSFVTTSASQDTAAIRKSVAAGNPLGIYDTKAKKLYLAGTTEINASANGWLLPYVGMRVFVIGKVYSKAGVNIILINDIGKSIK